jgi:hypothetical protein
MAFKINCLKNNFNGGGNTGGLFQPQLVVYKHQFAIYSQEKTQPLAWTGFILWLSGLGFN